jgi:hypothetical protein
MLNMFCFRLTSRCQIVSECLVSSCAHDHMLWVMCLALITWLVECCQVFADWLELLWYDCMAWVGALCCVGD